MFTREKMSVYVKLFLSTFTISAVTFGGGYVIVSLMKKKYVDRLRWFGEKEMMDMIALAQSCPGPIAVNVSILVGHRMAGAAGAFITVLGTILPPFLVLSVVSVFYAAFRENHLVGAFLRGMQAGVAALLADVVYAMGKNILKEKDWLDDVIMAVSFSAVFFLKVNVIFVILACGVFGFFFKQKKQEAGA